MHFVDKALARRLESAEEMPRVDCARMLQQLRPEVGAAFEPFCGGHMIFAGLNSPIGHAAGLGFDGSVTAADLDRLEAFYRSHSAPAQLDLCPLTDPSLLALVNARRYTIAELNNVLYRPLNSAEQVAVPSGVEIRRGKPEQAGLFSDLVSRSFFEKGDAPEGFADMLAPLFRFPEALTFVASVDEVPVSAAAGRIIPEHRVFALFGAGTLPEFRGRGIQTALLRTRMKAAPRRDANWQSWSREQEPPPSATACGWDSVSPTAKPRSSSIGTRLAHDPQGTQTARPPGAAGSLEVSRRPGRREEREETGS